MDQIFHFLLLGAVTIASFFFLIWLIHLPLKNAAVVDVGWGLGFILLCFLYITLGGNGFNLRNTIMLSLVGLWGSRIVVFLIGRILHENKEDARYRKFRDEWGKDAWWRFLPLFESQALLQLLISFGFIFVAINPTPGISIFEIVGAIVFLGSLLGESIADHQLQTFKRNPANKGKICEAGLWRYSRHPNYFFEWMIWVGLFIYFLGSPCGWAGALAPGVMYWLMMYVSGVPLAEEQSLKNRGEAYRQYQQVTSVFFPMPPKGVRK